jgi:hypothetical protein
VPSSQPSPLRSLAAASSSKLQFAGYLFRRAVEPRDVNGFRVFGRDPGLLCYRRERVAQFEKKEGGPKGRLRA